MSPNSLNRTPNTVVSFAAFQTDLRLDELRKTE
jgi:hypothetical protein